MNHTPKRPPLPQELIERGNIKPLRIELAKAVIEASMWWTGEDEEKNPFLKRARTLARVILHDYRHDPFANLPPCKRCGGSGCEYCDDKPISPLCSRD